MTGCGGLTRVVQRNNNVFSVGVWIHVGVVAAIVTMAAIGG